VFSVVIPVYRNEASIPELIAALSAAGEEMQRRFGEELEAVFVVDGSPDGSHASLERELPGASFPSVLLRHSRNFGAFAAIRSGLAAARGEYCGVMAADLQEPPELMLQFLDAMRRGECDVVVGRREGREDPPLGRLASGLFWRLYRAFVIPELPEGGVDAFGCTRGFRDELLRLEESNSSLVGLVYWLGFRRGEVTYARRSRRHGKSSWTLRKKVTYLFDSVFSFTDLPIRMLMTGGLIGLVTASLMGAIVLVGRLLGTIQVPGYTATALLVMFFGALNAFGLGIIGTYAWRAFENTKRRPLALVMDARAFGGQALDRARVATTGREHEPLT
jgi:glycosyltransferase involved in cell wall biosynthesis